MRQRRRRLITLIILLLIPVAGAIYEDAISKPAGHSAVQSSVSPEEVKSSPALEALGKLAVKGKAPKTGYQRDQFSEGWAEGPGCNIRNFILRRDMTGVITRSETDCTVMQGTLQDPYTGKTIMFVNGPGTSDDVQIDHVVALSHAWQTGAQQISPDDRFRLSNDPLNLLAVDGPTNQKKGDGDAATWLPPNKDYRCRYIARQIAVKQKYTLWVTEAERDAMQRVLSGCPDQMLPVVEPN